MPSSLMLPPFGRVLLAYQTESVRLDFPVYIFVGQNAQRIAFAQKRMGTLCTYLPYGDDFTRYRWPIEGQKAIVSETGLLHHATLKKFCAHLMQFYPRVLFMHSEGDPLLNEILLPQGKSYEQSR